MRTMLTALTFLAALALAPAESAAGAPAAAQTSTPAPGAADASAAAPTRTPVPKYDWSDLTDPDPQGDHVVGEEMC